MKKALTYFYIIFFATGDTAIEIEHLHVTAIGTVKKMLTLIEERTSKYLRR